MNLTGVIAAARDHYGTPASGAFAPQSPVNTPPSPGGSPSPSPHSFSPRTPPARRRLLPTSSPLTGGPTTASAAVGTGTRGTASDPASDDAAVPSPDSKKSVAQAHGGSEGQGSPPKRRAATTPNDVPGLKALQAKLQQDGGAPSDVPADDGDVDQHHDGSVVVREPSDRNAFNPKCKFAELVGWRGKLKGSSRPPRTTAAAGAAVRAVKSLRSAPQSRGSMTSGGPGAGVAAHPLANRRASATSAAGGMASSQASGWSQRRQRAAGGGVGGGAADAAAAAGGATISNQLDEPTGGDTGAPLQRLLRVIADLYDSKVEADCLRDVRGLPREPFPFFVFRTMLDRCGSKPVTCTECRLMLDQLVAHRPDSDAVHMFASFLDGSYNLAQLNVFLYARRALDATPFGADRSGDGDVVCAFRASLVARGVCRVLKFQGLPPGHAAGATASIAAYLQTAAAAAAAPAPGAPQDHGAPRGSHSVPYTAVTGFDRNAHALGPESAAQQLVSLVLTASKRHVAGGVQGMTLDKCHKASSDMASVRRERWFIPRATFLRLCVEQYTRQRVRRWQFAWDCWHNALTSHRKPSLHRGSDGAKPWLPPQPFLKCIKVVLPDASELLQHRLHAMALYHSATPNGAEWGGFMTAAQALRVFEDDFALLPRFTEQWSVPLPDTRALHRVLLAALQPLKETMTGADSALKVVCDEVCV